MPTVVDGPAVVRVSSLKQGDATLTPHPHVRLRPEIERDTPFLVTLYRSTREEELAVTGWSDDVMSAFIKMQFDAQRSHYRNHYKNAEFSVIEVDRAPVGRLYIARWSTEIRIIDIALLPEYRGLGIGSQLLLRVCAEGEATGKPVTIHVEKFNPALRLYRRLGFDTVEDKGVYLLLRWSPKTADSK